MSKDELRISVPTEDVDGEPLGVATWGMTDVTRTETGGYAGWVTPESSEAVWEPLDTGE